MGEKYDDECGGYELARPQPWLGSRIANPIGEGFPAPRLSDMLAGGPSGLAAVGDYAGRPAATATDAAQRALQTLRSAGDDPGARLQAGRDVVDQLHDAFGSARTQVAQANATFQILDDAGTYQPQQLAGAAREGARKLRDTVRAHFDPVDDLIDEMFTRAHDGALNAIGTHAEEAVNRFGELAHQGVARVARGIQGRGLADVPEPGSVA